MNFFQIAASAADSPADNPDGNKTFLASGVSTLFINGKPAVIKGLKIFENPPSWLANFLVVPFNKIPLFYKHLITFTISFISLLVRVFPELLNYEIHFLIFLPSKLSLASTTLSSIFLARILFDSFNSKFTNDNDKTPSDAFINVFLLS